MGDIITQHYPSANSYKFSSSFISSLTVQCHSVALWRRCKLSQFRESWPAIQQSQLRPPREPLCAVRGPLSEPGGIERHRTSPCPQSEGYQPVKKKHFGLSQFKSVSLQTMQQGCHILSNLSCLRLAQQPFAPKMLPHRHQQKGVFCLFVLQEKVKSIKSKPLFSQPTYNVLIL